MYEVDEVYDITITYVGLNKLLLCFVCLWMSFHDVAKTIIYLFNKNIQWEDSLLFDQLTYLKKKSKKSKTVNQFGKIKLLS